MLNTFSLTVPVTHGRCQFSETELDRVREFLARFEGKVVTVTWAKPKSTRSLRQNAYLWGFVYPIIAASTGNTTEDLHMAFKDMFLPRKFVKLGAKEIEVRKTTTDLTPGEFNEFIERICAEAATMGISIPAPQ